MQNQSRLLDIVDRAYDGPPCEERDFDLKHVAAGVARVVKEYDIGFDRSTFIQRDDDMIDRLFEASLDFLESCGVYNATTGRRMLFTGREIKEYVASAPKEAVIGEGRDAHTEVYRSVEDPRPPTIIGSPIGSPLSEDMYVPIMQSYIQEPIVDTTTPGTLDSTYGREPRTQSPYEVVAAWQEVDLIFDAARRAGRPGMSIGCVQMAISEIGHLSAISRGGYRPVDWHSIAMFSEMKVNNGLLIKVAHSVRTDGVIQSFYNPILGGLGGGEEGVAVLIVAGLMAMQLMYMAATHSSAPVTPLIPADTVPQLLRSMSAAHSALSRHTGMMTDLPISPLAGPGTETLLYEVVAAATVGTVCGASRLMGPRSATGVHLNHCTGLEARFMGEVGHAVTGTSREQAEEVVQRAVARYEPELTGKPFGKPFAELYDVAKVRPNAEWLGIYDEVKEEVASWGVDFG
ncbi:MAG: monomethylamine:corrinoid methyltransferase [Acidimicrobiia bacterium]|nr:monomethylamine:corrinoid methyltransferase [Acidimicrobiia bacterium]